MKVSRISRIISALFLSPLWLDLSAAYTPGHAGEFVVDAKSRCKVWNPNPQPGEAVNWSGDCVNGLAHGPGNLQWLKNDKPYEKDDGEWKEGRQSGRGTQDWGSGRYEGDLQNAEPHGRGILTLQSARYEGEFRNGKPDGAGTVTNLEGVFKGKWKEGCLIDDKRKVSFAVPSSSCH